VLVSLGMLLSGCSTSGQYPVSGRVTDLAGQPIAGLAGSQIVFNGASSSVGEIKDDGSFQLFTERPGDGVPPGDYEVCILRRYLDPERSAPQAIDGKYEKPETSGLKAKVEKKKNVFEFQVAPVARRGS
jgi:hypothetical protein